jgi:hypothetical protein
VNTVVELHSIPPSPVAQCPVVNDEGAKVSSSAAVVAATTSGAMRQSPTLMAAWVRSVRDAMLIFNAVANGVVPKVDRRLDENERRYVSYPRRRPQ